MPTRAVVLLSGGLDSILAIRILQLQDIEVEALNFRTTFVCCQDSAAQAAHRLGVRLSVIGEEDEYLDVIRKPEFGYGRGANPCVDCRIFMFQRARKFMEDIGASLVASGEVLGQRPNSQKRRNLLTIADRSGLKDYLLRPLSAKLLPETLAERQGLVDRGRLYDFVGRSRKGLIQLARDFQLSDLDMPSPSTGCLLTEPAFAPRVFDLLELNPKNSAWDFELLKVGRQIRFDNQTKVVIGRREAENMTIETLSRRADARTCALMIPDNFTGPSVLVVGDPSESALWFAGGLLARFSKCEIDHPLHAWVERDGVRTSRTVAPNEDARQASTI